MTDRVDEWALNYLHEFDGTRCKAWPRAPRTWASCKDEAEKKAAEEGRRRPSSPCWPS